MFQRLEVRCSCQSGQNCCEVNMVLADHLHSSMLTKHWLAWVDLLVLLNSWRHWLCSLPVGQIVPDCSQSLKQGTAVYGTNPAAAALFPLRWREWERGKPFCWSLMWWRRVTWELDVKLRAKVLQQALANISLHHTTTIQLFLIVVNTI